MTREEREAAIAYIKYYRKLDENLHNTSPKDSISYYATDKCLKYWDMALQALSQEPCDDAISRDAAIDAIENWLLCNDCDRAERHIMRAMQSVLYDLPSVTQKSGKWDRLYNWLNDMRLGITPDETVDDIDERHCREAQTDILDEIMEWMIKAESDTE